MDASGYVASTGEPLGASWVAASSSAVSGGDAVDAIHEGALHPAGWSYYGTVKSGPGPLG